MSRIPRAPSGADVFRLLQSLTPAEARRFWRRVTRKKQYAGSPLDAVIAGTIRGTVELGQHLARPSTPDEAESFAAVLRRTGASAHYPEGEPVAETDRVLDRLMVTVARLQAAADSSDAADVAIDWLAADAKKAKTAAAKFQRVKTPRGEQLDADIIAAHRAGATTQGEIWQALKATGRHPELSLAAVGTRMTRLRKAGRLPGATRTQLWSDGSRRKTAKSDASR